MSFALADKFLLGDSLAAVNFFLALVGITQVTRIALHESSKKGAAGVVEDVKQDVKENVEAVKEIKP